MVDWIRRKLAVYGFSVSVNKHSATSELSILPLDGEGDQAYLMRLILIEIYKFRFKYD